MTSIRPRSGELPDSSIFGGFQGPMFLCDMQKEIPAVYNCECHCQKPFKGKTVLHKLHTSVCWIWKIIPHRTCIILLELFAFNFFTLPGKSGLPIIFKVSKHHMSKFTWSRSKSNLVLCNYSIFSITFLTFSIMRRLSPMSHSTCECIISCEVARMVSWICKALYWWNKILPLDEKNYNCVFTKRIDRNVYSLAPVLMYVCNLSCIM